MTASSYEGFDPEHWEGTRTAVLTKPLGEVDPDDEYAAPVDEEEIYELPSLITLAVDRLKSRRSELKNQMNNLRSYPLDDSEYEDGTVLVWHDYDNRWGPDRHFAAIREEGRWYLTGEFHGHLWDELVTHRLLGYDFNEIEVIRPPEEK
jgi:hypothetical protein